MKLILFDIDRTLIGRSQCHHDAFYHAFKKVYNVTADIRIINYGGMTDPTILMEVLKKVGLKEDLIKSRMNEALIEIAGYFDKNVKCDDIPVLDGVRELLNELDNQDVIMGLITGNLESIAWGKMKKVSLDHYFKLGGFGSDNTNRTELVKIAIKRAEEKFDFKGTVFVIGDTPRDIKAGLEVGVKTLGVATGTYSMEELKKSGADFVFEDLKEKDEIIRVIMQS